MSEYRKFLIAVKSYLAKELGLRSNSLVLDCGTGRGLFAGALVSLGGVEVISVDSSIDCITEAKPVLKGRGRLVRADVRCLPFLESTFDYVVSEGTIHEIPQSHLQRVLQEMRRVIKPLGKVIAIETLPQPENETQELFLERHLLLGEIRKRRGLHEMFYEKEKLKEAFKLAGLSRVTIRIIKREFKMPPEAVKEYIDRLEKVHLKGIEGSVSDLRKKIADLKSKALNIGISLPPIMIVSGTEPEKI